MNGSTETAINFVVNDKNVQVRPSSVPSTLSLARFLRDHLHLTGTKIMCNQAGCGTCVVTAVVPDPTSGKGNTMSVNSCVTPVLSCQGWNITTVEGIGNPKTGLNPIQKRMVAYDASQCGYCTSGMIMQMNAHLENHAKPAVADIEDILDGNICRCTGYRPILDAFKSFATDSPQQLIDKLQDQPEDLQGCFVPTNKACPIEINKDKTCKSRIAKMIYSAPKACYKTEDANWWIPNSLSELLTMFKKLPNDSKYKLVAGNTGTGIYPDDSSLTHFIDINKISELREITKTPGLVMGANCSLHQVILTLESMAEEDPKNYGYGNQVVTHFKKVAHTAVRNTGTVAGNLMLKHGENYFPSDVFLNLEALGAMLVVMNAEGKTKEYLPSDWLKTSMDRQVLYQLKFPKLNSSEYSYASYKITPRRVNAHAYTNVATRIRIDSNFVVTEKPSIVCGGINPSMIHVSKTEELLASKSLKDPKTLKAVMESIAAEVVPDQEDNWHAESAYRIHLVQACVYKSILKALGKEVPKALQSAAKRELSREISSGSQSFKANPELWPMNKPVHKLEAQAQTTGTAEYVADIPARADELHGAFVYATVAASEIDTVDTAKAMAMKGVVAYFDHNDIPGKNNFLVSFLHKGAEEVFSSGKVSYSGQPIGLIVAETNDQAWAASRAVTVTYKNMKKPVLTIKEAMLDDKRVHPVVTKKIGEAPSDVSKVISGEIEIGSQYHYHMETQTAFVRPVENNEFDVFSSTQWMAAVQDGLSKIMSMPYNKFNVHVRRLGGGFGGKMKNSILVASAATLAANKLNRPVHVSLDLKANMNMCGKRMPYLANYDVGVTDDGLLQNVSLKMFCDCGFTNNEESVGEGVAFLQNVYNSQSWNVEGIAVLTDTPSNTYTRAPGTTQGHNIMEIIMEHVAAELKMDPLELKKKNFMKKGDRLVAGGDNEHPSYLEEENPMPNILANLSESSNLAARKAAIEKFNKENKWVKRGLSVVPCKYAINYIPFMPNYVHVSIFGSDGTIAVHHGGLEMGQGINTKVAQTVAKTLKAPYDFVTVKPANANVTPNNIVTGGSMTSEMTCLAALKTCQELRQRLDKVEEALENPVDWKTLINIAMSKAVDLVAVQGSHAKVDKVVKDYNVWGAVITEVEVDALTGEKNILRSDAVEDTGASISQAVDVGQIEGAFTFGLGLWTSEKIYHDPNTGKLLTDDTWNYKPPTAYDIPQELHVKLIEGDKNEGLLGSKATGEPAVHMGVSIALAIRNAVDAARKEIDPEMKWTNIVGPMTVEQIQKDTAITASNFTLQ